MGPEQNFTNTTPNMASAPANVGSDGIVFRDRSKKNKGAIVGMVCLVLLAAAGIGFGVWAVLDGNQKTANLNNQIETLKQQNSTLAGQVNELQAKIDEYESSANQDFYEILPPKRGEAEAVVIENIFTIKNADGEIYTQYDEKPIQEIVSCDSGATAASSSLTCIVKTADGAEAKFIYDYDEQSLEFIETTN